MWQNQRPHGGRRPFENNGGSWPRRDRAHPCHIWAGSGRAGARRRSRASIRVGGRRGRGQQGRLREVPAAAQPVGEERQLDGAPDGTRQRDADNASKTRRQRDGARLQCCRQCSGPRAACHALLSVAQHNGRPPAVRPTAARLVALHATGKNAQHATGKNARQHATERCSDSATFGPRNDR